MYLSLLQKIHFLGKIVLPAGTLELDREEDVVSGDDDVFENERDSLVSVGSTSAFSNASCKF